VREADHYRRSIYVFARRNLRYPLFDVFDRPDAGASCAQRNRSTTAIQSLQMLNSELSNRCATALQQSVTRVVMQTASPMNQVAVNQVAVNQVAVNQVAVNQSPQDQPWADRWIHVLFLTTLGRAASDAEVALFTPLAAEEQSRFIACLAILNSNEFLMVD
jgi:hypothetical protein